MPPQRVRPEPARELLVRQRGGAVVLSLEAPEGRTDGTPFEEDVTLRVTLLPEKPLARPRSGGRRVPAGPARAAGSVSWVIPKSDWPAYRVEKHLEVSLPINDLELKPGPSGSPIAGTKVSFIAEVQEGRRSRSATAGPVVLTLCDVVAPPASVATKLTPDGVLVSWTASTREPQPVVHVYRARPDASFPAKPFRSLPPGSLTYLDETARPGAAFKYLIRFGVGEEPTRCETEGSPEAVVTVVDLFAPSAPEGLAAAAEESVIRLFWSPGPESDIAGYLVYRADAPGEPFRRLTAEPVPATTYADTDVVRGRRYAYVVSAVDTATPPNESARSLPAEESLP